MLPVAAIAASYAGWGALALAMRKHQRELLGRELGTGRRRALRVFGAALLGLALWCGLHGYGATVGWVAWLGALSVGAVGWVLFSALMPRFALGSALSLGVAAVVATLVG